MAGMTLLKKITRGRAEHNSRWQPVYTSERCTLLTVYIINGAQGTRLMALRDAVG